MRGECLNHLVLVSERALWEVLEDYTEHVRHERPPRFTAFRQRSGRQWPRPARSQKA